MFLVFSPFTVSRLTIDAETEVNNNVFSFYSFIYGSEDEKIYKEWEKLDVAEAMQVFNSNFNSFKYFTEREIEDGYGNSINLVFLLFAAATMGQYEMYFPLYSSIPLFVLASLMLIVVIFQQSLLALLTNKRCQPLLITSSIIQCVFNIVALVFTIIFVICVQEYSIELYCKKDYALSLSAGIIVLVVFSVLLVISILLHTKKKKVISMIDSTML